MQLLNNVETQSISGGVGSVASRIGGTVTPMPTPIVPIVDGGLISTKTNPGSLMPPVAAF